MNVITNDLYSGSAKGFPTLIVFGFYENRRIGDPLIPAAAGAAGTLAIET